MMGEKTVVHKPRNGDPEETSFANTGCWTSISKAVVQDALWWFGIISPGNKPILPESK